MNINLLPWRKTRFYEFRKIFLMELASGFLFTVFLCMIFLGYHFFQLKEFNKMLMLTQNKEKIIIKEYENMLNLWKIENKKIKKEQFLKKKYDSEKKTISFLKEMINKMPKNVFLKTIFFENNSVDFSGESKNNESLSIFLKNIEKILKEKEPVSSETKAGQTKNDWIYFHAIYKFYS